ncbi:YfbK domain-containing protein [Ruegeria marisrubri]|uniref:YfbK domain-containing protein n=1 Tax=Ruegeria marisrubri TaxID=1685379 RepID=UPI001969B45E|nr:YfbK domain-containing protein [Ruegeria marisrubri]
MMTSDEALARAAASADRDAFATLLTRHYDRMFRLAFRLTGRAEAAEDLVQDICAALPAKFASFRGDAKFTTWLYRVIFNAAEDVGSDAVRNGPLRYATEDAPEEADEIGYFKLRYMTAGETDSRLIEQPILPGTGEVSDDVRFSTAIAGFGQLLRGGAYLGGWAYNDAIALASAGKGDDPFGYRAEAITLMRLAETLSQQ